MDIWEQISSGEGQAPRSDYCIDQQFWDSAASGLRAYTLMYLENMGPFWRHYVCSIPYLLEEQCRIGHTLTRSVPRGQIWSAYMPQGADGTDARTLAQFSRGSIVSVTGIDMETNRSEFVRSTPTANAHCASGDFRTRPWMQLSRNLQESVLPFNIIYCNVVFQFIECCRRTEIKNLKRSLSKSGLFFCLEKLHHPVVAEYRRRELIKDSFKSRYFSDAQLREKRACVLVDMERTMVKTTDLISALRANFQFVRLVWNSLNFYEFVASDDESSLASFSALLPGPTVPLG